MKTGLINLLLLIFTLMSICSRAQERQNGKPLGFDQKSDSISAAVLWWYENNVWDSFPKRMDVNAPGINYNKLQVMRMGTFTYEGKKYYALIQRFVDLVSRSPWSYDIKTYFSIYNEKQYGRLKTALDKKENVNVFISSQHVGIVPEPYNDSQILRYILFEMPQSKFYDEGCFPLSVQTLKGSDIVRFELPGPCPDEYDAKTLQRRQRKETVIENNEKLKTYYYELPISEFKKILID